MPVFLCVSGLRNTDYELTSLQNYSTDIIDFSE